MWRNWESSTGENVNRCSHYGKPFNTPPKVKIVTVDTQENKKYMSLQKLVQAC